jgi:hypothetical protein
VVHHLNDKITTLYDTKGLPVRGKDNRSAAEQAWHEKVVLASVPDNAVKTILELYLQDAEKCGVTEKTLDTYTAYFKSFTARHTGLLVYDLRPAHVRDWWDACHPEWKSSVRNLSGSALKAAFHWAAVPDKCGRSSPQPAGVDVAADHEEAVGRGRGKRGRVRRLDEASEVGGDSRHPLRGLGDRSRPSPPGRSAVSLGSPALPVGTSGSERSARPRVLGRGSDPRERVIS